MAIFNDPSQLISIVNAQNPHEGCEYLHFLDYTLDLNEEVVLNFSITEGFLPFGLSLDTLTGTISGYVDNMSNHSEYEVNNYILSDFASLSGDDIPFSDCPDLTVYDIKNGPLHISGQNYIVKGLKAYWKDGGGPLADIHFTITLNTEYLDLLTGLITPSSISKDFFIKICTNNDPKEFIHLYGNTHNNLKNDNMELVSPSEYISWRESQGHVFLSSCT